MAAIVPELAAEAAPSVLSGLEAGVSALRSTAAAGVAAGSFAFNELTEGAERIAKTYREIVGEPTVEINTGPSIEEHMPRPAVPTITPRPVSLNTLYPPRNIMQQMPNPPTHTMPLQYGSPPIQTQSTSEASLPSFPLP